MVAKRFSRSAQPWIAAVLVATLRSIAAAQVQLEVLTGSPPGADWFGQAISVNGDSLAVGSRYSVTLFGRDDAGTPVDASDDQWLLESTLLTEQFGDGFGHAVSLDADRLIVGAPGHGCCFIGPGGAFIYHRVRAGWTKEAELSGIPGNPAAFGAAVSIAGEFAAVGALAGQLSQSLPQNGITYAYYRDRNDTWHEKEKLVASAPGTGHGFGSSVAIAGMHLLVGAIFEAPIGAVYDFVRLDGGTANEPSDDTWQEHAKLLPPPGAPLTNFGYSISFVGSRALVGASGAAVEFRLIDNGTVDPTDDTWAEQAILTENGPGASTSFGRAVALSGERAAVGDAGDSEPDFVAGAAHLYQRDDAGTPSDPSDDAWLHVTQLLPEPPSPQAQFGTAVAFANDHLVVGERGFFINLTADSGDSTNGKVIVYAAAVPPWSYIDVGVTGTSGVPWLLGMGNLAVNDLVVLKLGQGLPSANSFLVLGLSDANLPLKGGILVPTPDWVIPVPTDGAGELAVEELWPPGVPAGLSLFLQSWIPDSGGPLGFAASNGLRATVP